MILLVFFILLGSTSCSQGDRGDDRDRTDGGDLGPSTDESDTDDACDAFVSRVCGPGGAECFESGVCQAALLMETYEPTRCRDGLDDNFNYPTCEADACALLVATTCGEALECSEQGACMQAMLLRDELNDSDATDSDRLAARDACAAGRMDALVFPACE